MDESQNENTETFRIATTTGSIWIDKTTANSLYILNEKIVKIKHTMTYSLPLFIQITLVINFIKSLFSKKARKRKDFVRKTSEAVSAISPLINMIK